MLGDENPNSELLLDSSTISQIFRSFYRDLFPSFWQRFDELVRNGSAVSVRHVSLELANARDTTIVQAIGYLENLTPGFFSEPAEREQALVREMTNDPNLSAAANRWLSKFNQGTEYADPYLIAKVRASILPATVVTEESQDLAQRAGIPYVCHYFNYVCHYFNASCINLQQMMAKLGWRF